MALKFEIIGNNLVVTDTADSSVKLERPASDVYGLAEASKFKIFTRTDRSDVLLSGDYANLVDGAGAALNATSLRSFFRTNLGFSKAGSSALKTTVATCKPWHSAGMINGTVSESSAFTGTYYGKNELPAQARRVRVLLTQRIARTETYLQDGNALTIATTYTKGLVVGDKIYVRINSGGAASGWYSISAISDGVNVTVTMPDAASLSGGCVFSKPLKGVKIAVAVTENPGFDSPAALYTPTVGGVGYNVPADAANPYGWRYVDFNIDTTANPRLVGSTRAGRPNGSTQTVPSFEFSADIELPPCTPTNGKGGYFLYRVFHDPTVSGTRSTISGNDLIQLNNTQLLTALDLINKPYFRRLHQTFSQGVDGIANLATIPANVNASGGMYLAFEFDYGKPVESCGFFGDSTTAGSKYEHDLGPANNFTADFAGNLMTLTSPISATIAGAPRPYPLSVGQTLTFTGSQNHADGTPVFVTGLVSGTPGVAGAVYSLSTNQTTASGRTVTPVVQVLQNWASWAIKAVYGKNNPDAIYEIYHGGMGAHTTEAFHEQVWRALEAGVRFTQVWLQGHSINDGGTITQDMLNKCQYRILKSIEMCRRYGVRKIHISTWAIGGGPLQSPTMIAMLNAHNDWIRNLKTIGVIDSLIDFEALRLSMGTNIFYSPTGLAEDSAFGDFIHMGRVAVNGMGQLVIVEI